MKEPNIELISGKLLTDAMILGNYIQKEYSANIEVEPQKFKFIVLAFITWIYHAALMKISPKDWEDHIIELTSTIDYWTSNNFEFTDAIDFVYKEMDYLKSGMASGMEVGVIFLRLCSQDPIAFEPQAEHMELIGFVNPLPRKLMSEYDVLIKEEFNLK
jgi:hypothetical protein